MKANGKSTRSIWLNSDGWSVGTIDQTALPHDFSTLTLTTLSDAVRAIKSMQVRGAPLIGATAAYGTCLALRADASDDNLERARAALLNTRPTAINSAATRKTAPTRMRLAPASRARSTIHSATSGANRRMFGRTSAAIPNAAPAHAARAKLGFSSTRSASQIAASPRNTCDH